MRANAKVLEGSLEITGTAETFVGHIPNAAAPTPLPPLGDDVAAPRAFEVVLPVRIGYDVLRQNIMAAIAASPLGATAVKDIQIYPSSGKLVLAPYTHSRSMIEVDFNNGVAIRTTDQFGIGHN